MLLLGEFEHAIDAKNRLAVPADIRDVLNASSRGESLIAAPGSNGSLWLWPETTFENLADEFFIQGNQSDALRLTPGAPFAVRGEIQITF